MMRRGEVVAPVLRSPILHKIIPLLYSSIHSEHATALGPSMPHINHCSP